MNLDAILMGGTVVVVFIGCNYRGETLLNMAFVEVFLFFVKLEVRLMSEVESYIMLFFQHYRSTFSG